MPSHQEPVNSPFGYRSTAGEVIDGIDLSGRCVVVTGGYSGIGTETVRAIAAAGAQVIVGARRTGQAHDVLDALDGSKGASEMEPGADGASKTPAETATETAKLCTG